MTRITLLCVSLLLLASMLTSPASATLLTYEANLDGLQEVPPNASPAFGTIDLVLDDSDNSWSVSGSFQDLLGGSTAAHIHGPAAPGVGAAVLYGLTIDSPGAATSTVSGSGTFTATDVTNIDGGLLYVNVHSNVFPGGEIRGQLALVPEPASIGLFAVGAAGIALLSRRRRVGR